MRSQLFIQLGPADVKEFGSIQLDAMGGSQRLDDFGLFGGGNHAVARQFVRNGWTVVAPVHTGNTTFDSIEPLPLDFEAVRADDRDLRATRPLRRAPVVTPAWHTLARAARWTAVAARPGSWSRALVP